MAISKNNPILKNHFRKDWQERVKTHFDQPAKKKARRVARAEKAAAVAPRPLDKLRPVVRCPTIRYNRKTREGRGFSLEEIKAAGLHQKYARTIGISVDHRRRNRNVEGFELNVARLKEYLARLIVFPKGKKASAADTASASQVSLSEVLPLPSNKPEITTAAVSSVSTTDAYETLQEARKVAKNEGKRLAELKAKAEAEK